MDIITKIRKAKLTGRGGAGFPTATKWEMVKNAPGLKKFVVANGSEGEPGIKKDLFLLEKYPDQVIKGIQIALEFLEATAGYLYLNPDYFDKMAVNLENKIGQKKIELFKKPVNAGYIGGEETSVLNGLEGKRIEPRLRPPFPTTNGLWGHPTLINNIETFYAVSLIDEGKYENRRFYSINGDCLWTGVYEFPEDWTIAKILRTTKNYPDFKFFVQVGGDASGEILNNTQLDKPVSGAGAITVYSFIKHHPSDLIKNWIGFFRNESCGQCTPCREGISRLEELINSRSFNRQMFDDLVANLSDTSFCALGASLPYPLTSYIKNVLPQYSKNNSIIFSDR